MAKLNTKEYERVLSLVNNTLNSTVKVTLIKKYNKKVKEFVKNNPPILSDDTAKTFDFYNLSNFLDDAHIQQCFRELRKDLDAELNKYYAKRDRFMLKISLDDKAAIKELDKFLKELEEVSKNV